MEQVSWHDLVWFFGRINKHSATAWLALSNGLKTKALLVAQNVQVDLQCILCNNEFEDCIHLFANLCCPAIIWWVWREKDFRIFREQRLNHDSLYSDILSLVRSRAIYLGLYIPSALAAAWNLPPPPVSLLWCFLPQRKSSPMDPLDNVSWWVLY